MRPAGEEGEITLQPTLTIIGCGHVGKALGRLLHLSGSVSLFQVLNRTVESAQGAISFMGAGQAAANYEKLLPAKLYLVAVPDDQIAQSARQLAATGLLTSESIVFHCSGSLPSTIMHDVLATGAAVASVHPIRSFASPEQVVTSFSGTWCGMEGTPRALSILQHLFSDIGAKPVAIDGSSKLLYHSAAVFASNYLVTLIDIALKAYEKAGIPRETGLQMLAPLVHKTVDNALMLGPETALSGPVARGDWDTVEKQYRAVQAWDSSSGELYKGLADRTFALAQRRRKL
jgi:predicted short-subunit dehydrogenase-like oxidoreductase (DUF2520 family)